MAARLLRPKVGRRARVPVVAALMVLPLTALVGLAPAAPASVSAPPHARVAQGDAAPCEPPAQLLQAEAPQVRRCPTPVELDRLLRSDYRGRVVIPRDADWEMRDPCGTLDEFGRCTSVWMREIPLRSGVELVGERGELGSRPTLSTADQPERNRPGYSLFRIEGSNDVRVEGIHFRGPKPASDRSTRDAYVHGILVVENAEDETGRRIVITDNEFEFWSGGAVSLAGNHGNVFSADWRKPENRSWKPLKPEDAGLVRIERNYIHHNVMHEGGYGVDVTGGAYATIEGNVFETNRHAVAGTGRGHSGYVARFNYVLEGGYKEGRYYNQHFDMHGEPRGGYGGYAGEYVEIAYNTIRGEQDYYCAIRCFATRPAFMLRGRTEQGAFFRDNVVVHDDKNEAIDLKKKTSVQTVLLPASERQFNLRGGGNRYDTDYSKELATGEFDGDGRTDVFVANGTGWFFSRAGVKPWQFLRASDKRVRELGFADIDNDGLTDVLYRSPDGSLGYVRSGTSAAVIPLTTSPVQMKDLRFGDFDADGLTDIFFTRGGRWQLWYGRTRAWSSSGGSSKPIDDLLFGDFDEVAGTDVVGITSNGWSYSSGSTSPWARMNGRLTTSFDDAVAADFDGNGRTDIAVGAGQRWRVSLDGRASLTTLRDGRFSERYPPLKEVLIGRFEGGTKAMALTFNLKPSGTRLVAGEQFVLWRGHGSSREFTRRSTQKMR